MSTVFRDPEIEPTETLIAGALGKATSAWDALTTVLSDAGATPQWRYYGDGGWLVKATTGSKTIAWLQVDDGFGRITFHFPMRLREALLDAEGVPPGLRARIADHKPVGRSLPVSLEIRDPSDVAAAGAVLSAKLNLR